MGKHVLKSRNKIKEEMPSKEKATVTKARNNFRVSADKFNSENLLFEDLPLAYSTRQSAKKLKNIMASKPVGQIHIKKEPGDPEFCTYNAPSSSSVYGNVHLTPNIRVKKEEFCTCNAPPSSSVYGNVHLTPNIRIKEEPMDVAPDLCKISTSVPILCNIDGKSNIEMPTTSGMLPTWGVRNVMEHRKFAEGKMPIKIEPDQLALMKKDKKSKELAERPPAKRGRPPKKLPKTTAVGNFIGNTKQPFNSGDVKEAPWSLEDEDNPFIYSFSKDLTLSLAAYRLERNTGISFTRAYLYSKYLG